MIENDSGVFLSCGEEKDSQDEKFKIVSNLTIYSCDLKSYE